MRQFELQSALRQTDESIYKHSHCTEFVFVWTFPTNERKIVISRDCAAMLDGADTAGFLNSLLSVKQMELRKFRREKRGQNLSAVNVETIKLFPGRLDFLRFPRRFPLN